MSVIIVVEASASTRKIGNIADYDPGNTPALNSAYQPVGVSMRQRQEWEETVPMTSSATCTLRPLSSSCSYQSINHSHLLRSQLPVITGAVQVT